MRAMRASRVPVENDVAQGGIPWACIMVLLVRRDSVCYGNEQASIFLCKPTTCGVKDCNQKHRQAQSHGEQTEDVPNTFKVLRNIQQIVDPKLGPLIVTERSQTYG